MSRIDPVTVEKILDATDIVEVVSDYVSLKRRGANYMGLCPFHNERTPSFSVSKSRGIFKCFSCGKGGSAVTFLMEIESMSYQEALRHLAKKYNIEIVERELSPQEQAAMAEREAMLAVNEFAAGHFEHNLTDTDDGRAIGLSYFRQRGINDAMIKRFHLGYALERNDDLLSTALRKGYTEQYLVATGLCSRNDSGRLYDRFRGRVIFPVHSLSGRVVAFGGRTLRSDKKVAKYVNSPESIIYHKSNELYGLYQARQAIASKKKCILVEGYMDVISMHQAGVQNVVASSGTSLTKEQVRLIKRFTSNVTVIYDSDAAGVKASLRGIDLLLAAEIDVKVLSLPDGDDPDSFAQSHSAAEVEEYLASHEVDFIRFKAGILMHDTERDPAARAAAITDILNSVALIPDVVKRQVYIGETSRIAGISEEILSRQVGTIMAKMLREAAQTTTRDAAHYQQPSTTVIPAPTTATADTPVAKPDSAADTATMSAEMRRREPFERSLLRYIVKYGMAIIPDDDDEENKEIKRTIRVIDYIDREMEIDGMEISVPLYARARQAAHDAVAARWDDEYARHASNADAIIDARRCEGLDEIRTSATSHADIERMETALSATLTDMREQLDDEFDTHFIEKILVNSEDRDIASLTADLVSERYTLSKVHSKFAHIATERERLHELVPRAIYELKDALIAQMIAESELRLRDLAPDDPAAGDELRKLIQMHQVRSGIAKFLGERIVLPRNKQ